MNPTLAASTGLPGNFVYSAFSNDLNLVREGHEAARKIVTRLVGKR